MRHILTTILGLTLLAGLAVSRRAAHTMHEAGQRYEDTYFLPPAGWLKPLSMGYRAAMADLLWVRALVYFGDELVHKGQVQYIYNYADAMIALDPDFKAVYRWIGVAAIYRSGNVTAEDAVRATDYLESAVHRWPDDGKLAWDLGATLRFELPPLLEDPEEKDRARERATEYLLAATRLNAAPKWIALSTAQDFEKRGQRQQAIRHLQEVYATVKDPATKERIEQRLAHLQGEAFSSGLRSAVVAFERNRREHYPYLPPGLFFVVGEKPWQTWSTALEDRFMGAGQSRDLQRGLGAAPSETEPADPRQPGAGGTADAGSPADAQTTDAAEPEALP